MEELELELGTTMLDDYLRQSQHQNQKTQTAGGTKTGARSLAGSMPVFLWPALFIFFVCLAGCSSIRDGYGEEVMSSSGVGRDADLYEKFEVEYASPITVNIHTNLAAIPSWIIRSGIPLCNVKSIKAERRIGAKSNVGSTASGIAQAVQAGAQFSPF